MSCQRKNLLQVASIIVVTALFPASPVLGEQVMVRRGFVPGRTVYLELQTDEVHDVSGMPWPPMKFQVEQLYGLWERVEPAAGDTSKVVLTFDRAARDVEAPMMGDMEFDTDDPEYEEAAPQLGVVLQPMIGMSMTMEVDKDGNVVSFMGMDAINKKISEQAVASMLWEQMKEEFTDEHARRSWGTDPLLIYPNKSVKVGDTWTGTSSFTQSRIGTIITDYRYKVDRIGEENGRKVVVIGVTGVVSRGPDAEADTDAEPDSGSTEPGSDEGDQQEQGTDDEETNKALPETEANGSMSGTAVYDVKLGRIVKQDDEGNVEIRIPLAKLIPEMGDSAGDQIATFKSTVKSTFVIRTEDERNAEKAEARKKAEMRRKAEQEEEEDEEDEEDDE